MSAATSAEGGATERALARARVLVDMGRWAQAVDVLGPVVAAAPDDGDAWCLLAQARLNTGDRGGALEAAGRAVRLEPDREWPHRIASVALEGQGRATEALAAAQTCVRLSPNAWQAHLQLADTAATLGQRAVVRQAVERALALGPDEAEVHVLAARHARSRRTAREHHRRALALEPDHSVAQHELTRLSVPRLRGSMALLSPGESARATDGYAQALRSDPQQKVSQHGLAVVVGAVVFRTVSLVLLTTLAVGLVAPRSAPVGVGVGVGVGLLAAVAYPALFVRSASSVTRAYLVRSLRDGYKVTAAFTALSVVVLAWWAGSLLLGAGAPGVATPSVGLPFAAVVAVWVQNAALRRRALRA